MQALFALIFAATAAIDPTIIRPEAIRAHVRFLSDDLLQGRGTGTRGYDIAASYVAANFEAFGLEPAGADGTFLQPVPLVHAQLDGASLTIRSGEKTFTCGDHCIIWPDLLRETSEVEAPVVFAGYGISAPELGWDDYAGIEVKGKIVAFVRGAPDKCEPTIRAVLGDILLKERTAAEHGAVGVLRLAHDAGATWRVIHNSSRAGGYAWVDEAGKTDRAIRELRGRATLNEAAITALFEGSGTTPAEALKSSSQRLLPARVQITTATRTSKIASPNVVAVLRGRDPVLRDEYVVYSAHLDHLGIGPAIDGDAIYNGAMDNASGTSGLIEIARAFASLEEKPARSILFLAVTAEERGLLGSDYFAANPTVPPAQIVGNINLDGLTRFATTDIVARGAEHSTLSENVRRAASVLGYEVSPDPIPEQALFVRSDQYSFVKKGIPSLYVTGGVKSVDPALDLRALGAEWRAKRYHLPADDFSQPMDWNAMARFARFDFLLGLDVANQPARPQWNRDDVLGKRFK